jgi:TIR domain
MKVFLSWSGVRSKRVADALRDWLPLVIQAVEPWMSDSDIDKGARWGPDISDRLEESRVGIVCLTSDNLGAPWILFEAGALAKMKNARVCTLLLDITKAAVEPPLGQFQATLVEQDDVKKLVETIARTVRETGEKAPADEVISKSFKRFWPDLEASIAAAKAMEATSVSSTRTLEEISEEILATVRRLEAASRDELKEFKMEEGLKHDFMRELLLRNMGAKAADAEPALTDAYARLREARAKPEKGNT